MGPIGARLHVAASLLLLLAPGVAYGQVSKVAFHTYRDGNAEVYTMLDNGTMQVNLSNHPARDKYPVVCGTKVVFASDRDAPGKFDIWVQNIDGSGTPTNLTPNTPDSDDYEASCGSTPYASNRVVFRSNRDGNDEIYRMKLDGTDLVRLTYNNHADENPQWCGNEIIFVRDLLGKDGCGSVENENCPTGICPANPGTDYQLFIMHADGDGFPGGTPPPARQLSGGVFHNLDPGDGASCNPTPFGTVLFYWPSCHPDGAGGQDVVFSAYRPANYGGRQIYRMPLCTSGLCLEDANDLPPSLTQSTDLSIQNDFPSWSPGGNFIVFASDRPNPDDGQDRDWDIYRMNADDGSLVIPLTVGPNVRDEDPHWKETKNP